MLSIMFFFISYYYITQTWSDLDNYIKIEQPTKINSLWKDFVVLARESEVWS